MCPGCGGQEQCGLPCNWLKAFRRSGFQASSPAHITRQQVPDLRENQMFILWGSESGKALKSQDLGKGENVMPFKKTEKVTEILHSEW